MATTNRGELFSRQLRTLQVIIAAITIGAVLFMAIAAALRWTGQVDVPPGDPPIVTIVLLILAVLAGVAAFAVPAKLVDRQRRRIAAGTWTAGSGGHQGSADIADLLKRTGDTGKLWLVFHTKSLVGAAFLEAAAFTSIVAYLIHGHPILLGVVAAIFVLLLAAQFPTEGRLDQWLDDQLRRLEQERPAGHGRAL
jgi:hypothetical protein